MQKVETLWQILFLLVSIVGAVLFQKVYLFQTHDHFASVRKSSMVDILLGVLFAIFQHIYQRYLHSKINPWILSNYIRFDKYKQPDQRLRRCDFLTKTLCSSFYYAFSSITAYILIRNTSMMPTWLGGSGQCVNAYILFPQVVEGTLGMRVFLMIAFGKNLNRMLTHAFIREQGNYYEFLLHHGMATFLILFSYLMNLWLIGVFIILIHDISDLALGIARFYLDYRHKQQWLLSVIYVVAFTSWIGTRIIIHVGCCCIPIIEAFQKVYPTVSQFQMHVFLIPAVFMSSMVYCLEVMHLFWTYYILRSFLAVNISTKVTHNYD